MCSERAWETGEPSSAVGEEPHFSGGACSGRGNDFGNAIIIHIT